MTHNNKRTAVPAKAHTLAFIDRELSSANGRKEDNRMISEPVGSILDVAKSICHRVTIPYALATPFESPESLIAR
jgi:hypothetical protein